MEERQRLVDESQEIDVASAGTVLAFIPICGRRHGRHAQDQHPRQQQTGVHRKSSSESGRTEARRSGLGSGGRASWNAFRGRSPRLRNTSTKPAPERHGFPVPLLPNAFSMSTIRAETKQNCEVLAGQDPVIRAVGKGPFASHGTAESDDRGRPFQPLDSLWLLTHAVVMIRGLEHR